MKELYLQSIFVPVGRGAFNSECFRATEACTAGAIPVVVVSAAEREFAYGTLGQYVDCPMRLPPFVFAESWDDAVIACKKLLDHPEQLLQTQSKVIAWWNEVFARMIEEVRS